MNIELLELAAAALDDLLGEVAFVGGATIERPRRTASPRDQRRRHRRGGHHPQRVSRLRETSA